MSTAIVWFRRDLRCQDNPALAYACAHHETVIPVYIDEEPTTLFLGEAQKWWLHHSLIALTRSLNELGMTLILRRGESQTILTEMLQDFPEAGLYWNRCYEPRSLLRDKALKAQFGGRGIAVKSFNAALLHEPWEIMNQEGNPFKVFTPYWRACLKQGITRAPTGVNKRNQKSLALKSDSISSWSLLPTNPNWALAFEHYWQPGERGALNRFMAFCKQGLQTYREQRDFPAEHATSSLSPHLHFGEISPLEVFNTIREIQLKQPEVSESAQHFLSELGWREFSYYLLYHFPELPEKNFRPEFDQFPWREDTKALQAWQRGRTGYPIIDAGMRELWATGTMHNRVRMIVASFLTKDLLIDWRQGAAWFLDTLLDADLANNSAGWQWVAGCGADAAPYFRIFNPVLQSEKFDPQGVYIKQWVPELQKIALPWLHKPWEAPQTQLPIVLGKDYPYPLIDHAQMKQQALMHYQSLKKPN